MLMEINKEIEPASDDKGNDLGINGNKGDSNHSSFEIIHGITKNNPVDTKNGNLDEDISDNDSARENDCRVDPDKVDASSNNSSKGDSNEDIDTNGKNCDSKMMDCSDEDERNEGIVECHEEDQAFGYDKINNGTLLKANVEGESNLNLYHELMCMDNNNLNFNQVEFECPICFVQCKPNKGVILMDCLHCFCKECIAEYIKNCLECEIECPFRDNVYSCESIILHCELKEIVDTLTYEKILERSFNMATSKIDTFVHCKTRDCPGGADVMGKSFICEVCRMENCVECNGIHTNLTCELYQRSQHHNAEKYTQAEVAKLIAEGRGMRCPACGILVEKMTGCDGLQCLVCKTHLCWATKGRRWGPGGKGDTSGGCRCGVYKRCSPLCNNCH